MIEHLLCARRQDAVHEHHGAFSNFLGAVGPSVYRDLPGYEADISGGALAEGEKGSGVLSSLPSPTRTVTPKASPIAGDFLQGAPLSH